MPGAGSARSPQISSKERQHTSKVTVCKSCGWIRSISSLVPNSSFLGPFFLARCNSLILPARSSR